MCTLLSKEKDKSCNPLLAMFFEGGVNYICLLNKLLDRYKEGNRRVGKAAPNAAFCAIYQERAHRITTNQQKGEVLNVNSENDRELQNNLVVLQNVVRQNDAKFLLLFAQKEEEVKL